MATLQAFSNFPAHKNYLVRSEHDLHEVLSLIPETADDNLRVSLDGCDVKIASHRLVNYKIHGVECVTCGRAGSVWRVESNNGEPHLNLYTADGAMMTKDHIIPRKLGGIDHVDNYQPMCKKASKIPANSLVGKRMRWIRELIWFMDEPYEGVVILQKGEDENAKVMIQLDNGSTFGWSSFSDFKIVSKKGRQALSVTVLQMLPYHFEWEQCI